MATSADDSHRPSTATPQHMTSGTSWREAAWREDLDEPLDATVYHAPRTISIRCATHGMHGAAVLGVSGLITFVNMPEECTVWELKACIDERLMLRPEQGLRLFSWGRELEDHKRLTDYRIVDKTQLDAQLCTRPVDPDRELHRVRVTSTLLKTKQVNVDRTTTVDELKRRIEKALRQSEHEWWSKEGVRTSCEGMTYIAGCTLKDDPKAGTSAIRQGEELISDYSAASVDRKKGLLILRRAGNGRVVNIHESSASMLELPPHVQRLDFHGCAMADEAATLWSCGVRHDDHIQLEFLNPVMPEKLKIVRAPAPERKAKKGDKAKGGAKKKK